ncbi:MAG TPA: tricarballylate utilization 4Fe-4S protein TcuB [Gammaproteobacteria bacterium]|nr:tricarballylate utilization 4Fe-4S protein TcuB [Gammaproteobacteria bacterium]
MQTTELEREGARVMTVCNACRYCEQYCPAFQAMEQRVTFAGADLNYVANLCHGCGECLYACQYAPPHELAINVPKLFAQLRVRSYEQYAWPAALGAAFRRQGVWTALLLAAVMIALLLGATVALNRGALLEPGASADFYAVAPHGVMAALFGGIGVFVLVALAIGAVRCVRDQRAMNAAPPHGERGGTGAAFADILTLNHLHVAGRDCVTRLEVRTPWRRWLHHATFYGFMLCFASTCVATLYHLAGAPAPYGYSSLPVLLGTAGGIGLLIGTAGALLHRRARDAALSDAAQDDLDRSFLVLLLLTAATGLLLLALRHERAMGLLLVVHLGVVLALFLTLPYGKLVHGIYRGIALLRYRRER